MGKISKMNELINDIIYSVSLVRNDIEFNNIEKSVLGMKNARLSYEFARNFSNANVLLHGNVIIDSGDLYYNYLFARDINGSDVVSHGNVIINSGSPEYNYIFARDVDGSDIFLHQNVIIGSGDVFYNYLFALNISGIDIDLHKNTIISSGNGIYIDEFFKLYNETNNKILLR